MRRAMLQAAMLAALPGLTSAAQGTSATGTWKVHADFQGTSITLTCVIEEKENKLTGTCTGGGDDDTVARPIEGDVTEKGLTWHFDARYEGKPVAVSMRAVLDDVRTKMYGQMDVAPIDAEGTFLAEKQTAHDAPPAEPR